LSVRVSTLDQKTDRQKVNEKDFDTVIEDKCSGAVPFFERQRGKEIKMLIEKDALKSLAVWSIDRLGRDLRDIINTIYYFSEKKIAIQFISQGLTTLDANGKENSISKMMISILGRILALYKPIEKSARVAVNTPVTSPAIKGAKVNI
jgi:DNA invertase Pin-like site-specific DNA recombinase